MKTTAATPPLKLTPLKKAAEQRGIPYGSARDMVLRGQLRVFKSGERDRYARWYVNQAEFDQFIESRMEKLA